MHLLVRQPKRWIGVRFLRLRQPKMMGWRALSALPSAPEYRRINLASFSGGLVGLTTGRELRPAPKIN
ncbi:hypothetical protein ACFL1K_05700 [Candidatus Omnitrophota bacterium]